MQDRNYNYLKGADGPAPRQHKRNFFSYLLYYWLNELWSASEKMAEIYVNMYGKYDRKFHS